MSDLSPSTRRIAEEIDRLPAATRDSIGRIVAIVLETITDYEPDMVRVVADAPAKYSDRPSTPKHLRLVGEHATPCFIHPATLSAEAAP